ncbi:MAG: isoprenylcysteine carboxylmethyltransferase family protein [Cyclobacteriaceae bacterium]|jgi:protein-S-isoprenylcysteine O-methyltransferase Ste14
MASILKLILFWILYFIIHSLFASTMVKKKFGNLFPRFNRFYRAIYVFFSVAGLAVIFLFQSSLPFSLLYEMNTLSTGIGLCLASFGMQIILESFSFYDTAEFLGFRQAKGILEEQGFIKDGILKYIRHPLYSGSMLFLIGYLIFAPNMVNMVAVALMIIYFIIGSYFEEKKLIKSFGKSYSQYRSEVPAFIPRLNMLFKGSRKAKKL